MSQRSLYLLGPPRVERDGNEVQIPRRKALALLAYLALTRRSHRRDALATLLWPEHDQATARAYLRRALTALRKALGDDWLDADRETIGLDPNAELWLDVDTFHEHLTACRTHGHPPDETCPDCLPLLEQAAALYCDDLLAGFTLRDSPAYDDWQFFQTQALRDELAGILQRLAERYAAQGAFEQAIPHARRWLALDPLHEPAHRALMRLYAWSGQRAAALHQYDECQRVLQEELGAPPEEETTQLYESIQAHRALASPATQLSEPAAVTPTPKHNLPAQLTPFVGREALLDEIAARLDDPGCRLLTLLGPGGSGKTRLALESANRQLDRYSNGVWFVALASIESIEGIVPAVAQAMGFAFHGEGEPREQLLAYLRQKQALIVLDNFEHLLPGANLAVDILTEAPKVKVLVTSRAKLSLQGEHLHPIEGMKYPEGDGPADTSRYSAIKLFVSAAQRVDPGFALNEQNRNNVVRICQLVEGMPLGILLAASWLGALTPAEIADEVAQSLDFLEADWSDAPARQRSMRAVFDHSWDLLDEKERALMAQLSVFRGGCTREAAGRVAGASLRDLTMLTNRSLLHRSAGGRYEMHELLRQYAAEKLAAEPDVERETQDRHCAYYAAALERWDADLKGARQLTALAEIEADIGNARAAWEWAVEKKDMIKLDQAMDGLCRFYEWRGRYEEGEAACRAAAEALDKHKQATTSSVPSNHLRVQARAVAWRGVFCRDARRLEQARELLEVSLVHMETLSAAGQDVRRERAFALYQLGFTLHECGEYADSHRGFEQSLSIYRTLNEHWATAVVLHYLGDGLTQTLEFAKAEILVQESLSIQKSLGDRRGMAGSLRVLGVVAIGLGHTEESLRFIGESIAAFRSLDDRAHAAEALINMGYVMILSGRLTKGRLHLKNSVAIYSDLGFGGRSSSLAIGCLAWVNALLGNYEPARTWAERSLSLAQESGHRWAAQTSLGVLGMLAVTEGNYVMAQRYLENGYQLVPHQPTRSVICGAWGLAACGLQQYDYAREQLFQALHQARTLEFFQVTSLPAVALLLASRGQVERAVELYALASRYPSVADSPLIGDVAGQHIAAAARALPPEVVEDAKARGRTRDLEVTVKELLEELGEENSGG